ncbi:MAG: SU10 major capsid protein [Aeromonas popoffii]|uniref:SU10 major capsid protein n=1 Tax=Aeromonas popoffii TaxID=70856 RepID=UPI003F345261
MSITKMNSYDLKGDKLSFADWVSNISPTETPFVSMTGKEGISQTKFQWQTDVIPTVRDDNACFEGSVPAFEDEIKSTIVLTNNTQIFRRSVSVSDTANVVSYYGRQKEIGYQMEKAGAELKRDMEMVFLSTQTKADASTGAAGKTDCFVALVGTGADADTGATVVKETATKDLILEKELFDLTYNLYLANSKANVIMYHPKNAGFFSGLLSVPTANINRMKMFGAMDDEYNTEVDTIVDPLGQRFALVPNRLMPTHALYFFNPSDWTQMVLRAPKKIQLAKVGSSEEWVIEAEVGLRHRNKFASGILKVKNA